MKTAIVLLILLLSGAANAQGLGPALMPMDGQLVQSQCASPSARFDAKPPPGDVVLSVPFTVSDARNGVFVGWTMRVATDTPRYGVVLWADDGRGHYVMRPIESSVAEYGSPLPSVKGPATYTLHIVTLAPAALLPGGWFCVLELKPAA